MGLPPITIGDAVTPTCKLPFGPHSKIKLCVTVTPTLTIGFPDATNSNLLPPFPVLDESQTSPEEGLERECGCWVPCEHFDYELSVATTAIPR